MRDADIETGWGPVDGTLATAQVKAWLEALGADSVHSIHDPIVPDIGGVRSWDYEELIKMLKDVREALVELAAYRDAEERREEEEAGFLS